jgi:ankyrin repeat protein
LFLLNTERGDLAAVKRIVTALGKKKTIFDIDCVDPLGRSGLIIAIENENLDMIQFLLESGINPKVFLCCLSSLLILPNYMY